MIMEQNTQPTPQATLKLSQPVAPPPTPSITPAKPKNRLFISLVIFVILLSLGAAGFFAYQNYQLTHQPMPIQPPPSPIPDPTANWKTYTNTQSEFSFQYPNDWISTPGDNLHAPDNSISMWIQTKIGGMECFNLIKSKSSIINGKNFNIQYFSGADSDICSNPNERTIYFGQQSPFFTITYSYNQNNQIEAEKIFDQILSTFKFTEQAGVKTTGDVSGRLCYPSEFIPPGEIIVKNVQSGTTVTQSYLGTESGGGITYTISLPEGMYHLKFQTAPDYSGYYTECAKNPVNDICSLDTGHQHIDVSVTPDQVTKNIDLCDFYATEVQKQALEQTF
jgi:hypothetical protein